MRCGLGGKKKKKRSGISVNNQLVLLPVSVSDGKKKELFLISHNNKLIFSVVFQH